MRIYLDTCALLRLTDDQRQPRIYREAKAVEEILDAVERDELEWLVSDASRLELENGRDASRRDATLGLLSRATGTLTATAEDFQRARHLREATYGDFDALHLALAERAQIDVLLTTDNRMISLAKRSAGEPLVLVVNPVDWRRIRSGAAHDIQQ